MVDALSTTWRADRRGTVVSVALQLVGALSGVGLVLASKLALDAVLGASSAVTTGTVVALALLALATAVGSAVGVLESLQQRLLGERVSQRVWRELLQACAATDLYTWESTAFLDRLDRVRFNAIQRPNEVVGGLLGLVGSLVGAAGLAVALVQIEPLLVPVLLGAGIPAVYFSRLASRAEFAYATASNPPARARAYVNSMMTTRPYAAEIRAFDSARHLLGRQRRASEQLLVLLERHVARRRVLGLVSAVISAAALAATFVIIVLLVRGGRMSLSEAGAAAIAARLLSAQLAAVFASVATLVEASPFLSDFRDFVADTPAARPTGTRRPLEHALELDSIRFSYDGRDAPAVDGVSISVPAGRVVAIVGENGSGKTTLARVVAGLFEPQGGRVVWDGSADLPPEDRRSSVSALFQDFVRYQLSVVENIAIADTSVPVDRDRAAAAAGKVGIHEAVASLADGYDTVLGVELSEGTDLSGGQWQRLALARALYRDTPVVVLDEPSAALDPRAEYELFTDVRRLLDGRSALLISHRYSSVQLADYIYVMHAGRVVEEGTHRDLVAAGGRYAELYALQAAAYRQDLPLADA